MGHVYRLWCDTFLSVVVVFVRNVPERQLCSCCESSIRRDIACTGERYVYALARSAVLQYDIDTMERFVALDAAILLYEGARERRRTLMCAYLHAVNWYHTDMVQQLYYVTLDTLYSWYICSRTYHTSLTICIPCKGPCKGPCTGPCTRCLSLGLWDAFFCRIWSTELQQQHSSTAAQQRSFLLVLNTPK